MILKKNRTSRRAVLIVATLTSFMAPFMISAVNIALPAIQAEFSVSAVLLSWIATAYLLASAVLLVPIAKIADMVGRKKTLAAGILVFSIFSAVTALVTTPVQVIFCRILQGAGAAMVMTTSIAIVAAVFPLNQRGRAIGITVAAVYIGLSAGPFAAGHLIARFGWRSIFLFTAPLGLIAFFLTLKMIREEWADARGERLDLPGTLAYGISIVGLIYGLSILPALPGLALVCSGLTGLVIFVRIELKTPSPVFEVRLFQHNRPFTFSSLAALINYAATFAVAFYLSLYLQYIKGLSPQTTGAVLVCQPLVQALFSPLAGRFSDRVEPARIASAGMALTAVGLVLLVFLRPQTRLAGIVATLLLLGIGFALFSSPNMNAIMSSVAPRYYGLASGTVATMRLIGQMLSMAVATMIFSFTIGNAQIAPENYPLLLRSVKLGFAIFSILCSLGIYFSLARGAVRTPHR